MIDSHQRLDDGRIRAHLRRGLEARHRREADTVLIDELGLCRGLARVDLAVVNGRIHGYEIKSDRDDLRRLASQAETYGKVLDRATLVLGARYVDDALVLLPEWWGVARVEATRNGARFVSVRRGARNRAVDARSLAELLWRDDALTLLAARETARGWTTKPNRVLWDAVCACYSLPEVAAAVRRALKGRAALAGRRAPW